MGVGKTKNNNSKGKNYRTVNKHLITINHTHTHTHIIAMHFFKEECLFVCANDCLVVQTVYQL